MPLERDKRQEALNLLDEQEQEARGLLERSKAHVKSRQDAYKVQQLAFEAAKAEFQKAFYADAELKKVVQRNTDRITERRRILDGVGDEVIDVLQPLDLEHIEAPEPEVQRSPPKSKAKANTNQSTTKKGVAKKAPATVKKVQSGGGEDDRLYRTHRKQAPEMFIDGEAVSGRTRRVVKPAVNEEEPESEEEQDLDEIDNDGESEEGVESMDGDRSRRESSQESIASHITVARKPSPAMSPAPVDAEEDALPIDGPYDDPAWQEAMDWANQPYEPGFDTDFMRDEPQTFDGQPYDETQWRRASPAASIASSSSSSSSGLFVSERPRTRRRSPSPLGESYPAGDHMSSLPFAWAQAPSSMPKPRPIPRTSYLDSMLPPERPAFKPRSASPEDSLLGDSITVQHRSSPDNFYREKDVQLPTPDPSGSHGHDRSRSRSPGLFVSGETPAPQPRTQPQKSRNGNLHKKRNSADGGDPDIHDSPSKKRNLSGKKGKSAMDVVRSGRW